MQCLLIFFFQLQSNIEECVCNDVITQSTYVGITINKQLLDEVFCDIQNNQGRGRGYQTKPKAEADIKPLPGDLVTS